MKMHFLLDVRFSYMYLFLAQCLYTFVKGVRKWSGQGPLSRKLTSCEIMRIGNGNSRACVLKPVASVTKPIGRSTWTSVSKRKAISMGRDLSRDSDGKKALNRQIIIGCYLQFVVKNHQHAALFWTGHGASRGARKLHRRLTLILQQPQGMVPWNHAGALKEIATVCVPRREIRWASSCFIFSLKVIELLQVRRV